MYSDSWLDGHWSFWMSSAKQIIVIAAVVVLIGWIVTGWGVLLVLALGLGLFGSIGMFEGSSAAWEGEPSRRSVVVTDVAPIKPAELVSPGRVIVAPAIEEAVKPSVGRRLFLDDVADE